MILRRIITSILALTMAVTCFIGVASAANTVEPQSSVTLGAYSVTMKAGSNSGELRINYTVNANSTANSVGVSLIKIYKSNGTLVATITGTTSNGLIATSSFMHAGQYTYSATSGTSYYAKVTVFATIGSITDSRVVTTATVTAP